MNSKSRLHVCLAALAVAALSFSTGCATSIDVKRQQSPILAIQDDQPGIGLLNVSADDDVMARAPNDFSNMTGLVSKAAKDYVTSGHPELKFVDYTDLGYRPAWKQNRPQDRMPYTLDSLPGIPAGVQTPLVLAVKVVDWRTFTETQQKQTLNTVHIALQFTTWTREGQLVKNEVVDATAKEGTFGVALKTVPENPMMVNYFEKADGKQRESFFQVDREKLFWGALREAVGVELFPFQDHEIAERFVLVDDDPYKPGVLDAQAGRFDDALAKWSAIYEKDPKAHGALYDAGLVYLIKGDDQKALECFSRAVAGDDKFMYRQMEDSVKNRIAARKNVTAHSVAAWTP